MEITELRIGNYFSKVVDDIHYGDYVVTKIDKDNLVNEHGEAIYIGYCEPIPLTEEWLLKFGFRPLDNKNWHLGKIKVWSGATRIYFQFNTPDDIDDVEIEYVHQLQNLYFALTGEELNIEL